MIDVCLILRHMSVIYNRYVGGLQEKFMKTFEAYSQIHPSVHYVSVPLIKSKASKTNTHLPFLRGSQSKPKLSFSKHDPHYEFEQELPHSDQISFEEAYSQAKHHVSLIEDPLWKSVCAEMVDMMGPLAVLRMWNSSLGSFSYQHKTMDLYCQTEEIVQFICQYSFVVLGSLQRYFPMMKDLKVKIKPIL